MTEETAGVLAGGLFTSLTHLRHRNTNVSDSSTSTTGSQEHCIMYNVESRVECSAPSTSDLTRLLSLLETMLSSGKIENKM